MDVNDVSDDKTFVDILRNAERSVELASRRKGQMVRDHPSPEWLIMTFLMRLRAAKTMPVMVSGQVSIVTSQIPASYAPCVRPSGELNPIMISDMKLETHHRGSRVMLRVRTPPHRITALLVIVEDEQGTAVFLQLYNQPEESVVPAEELIRPESVLVLKEPFFKRADSDGSYSLRVDHPGDLVWLDDTDERVPSKWRHASLGLPASSSSIRMQGNSAVQNQAWAVAERL